ncbi:MarR family winged helix-turn-helix transcriptional regulator [Paenibacillus chitinolyticus]|uniref:MarR family winged helix-turn-helix transcriptional regulator n=1 Tax=Paenibacillus chitinolyticus TaxID=79263 RepID=UPI0036DAE8AF
MNEGKAAYELLQAKLLQYLHSRDKAAELKKQKALDMIGDLRTEGAGPDTDLSQLTLTQMHVLHEIAGGENANVTQIANHIGVTKGGVSKAVAKLIQAGLAAEAPRHGSKREIHYLVTPRGEQIAQVHDKLHQLLEKKHFGLYSTYSGEELSVIARFLDDLTRLNEEPL